MPEEDPILVQEQDTGEYGVCYPDEGVIETYDGDERVELDVDSLSGKHWHSADQDELRASIDADIEEVREEIAALRGSGLTDAQARQLDRLESRLDSQENTLELIREANDA